MIKKQIALVTCCCGQEISISFAPDDLRLGQRHSYKCPCGLNWLMAARKRVKYREQIHVENLPNHP